MSMRFIGRLVLFLTLSLFFVSVSGRNERPFFFSHLGVEDGLSQVSVLNIFQDSEGYIWFGTRNGANRYDGYEFKIYQNEVNNQASISDNYIRSINEDSQKNIWVGTSNGMNCIDYKTKKITRFYPQIINPDISTNAVHRFFKHSDGHLYAFTTRSMLKCSPDKTVEYMPYLTEVESPIYAIVQDEQEDIYIGTEESGLYIFSSDWKLKHHFPADSSSNRETLPTSTITVLLASANNTFIGTDENGVCVYNKEKQSFKRLNTSNSGLNNNSVRTMLPLNKDSILIGTFRGLNILNTTDMHISPIEMNMDEEGSLSHYSIHSMLIDRDQTLWVGTYSAGVNYHSPFYKPVSFITPEAFTGIIGKGGEDENGKMWFATEGGGLLFYDPLNGKQQLYPIKPLHEGNYEINIIKSILIKGDSIFCSTHFGSVYLFSIKSKQFRLLYDFKHNDIMTLYLDSRQRLWIPTFTPYQTVLVDGKDYINMFDINGEKQQLKGINAINEIEPNVFLLGGYNDSLYLYDMNKQVMQNISVRLRSKDKNQRLGTIAYILKDYEDELWIATTKGGLFRLDKNLELVKNYQKEDGLSASYITSISIDRKGDIWVVTGNELYKLNRFYDKFNQVKPVDSPTQEFTLYAGDCISSDGTLYFPGNRGILSINPQKMTTNPNSPPIYITSLVVNNPGNSSDKNEQNTILYPSEYEDKITLDADQSSITIRYTAINYVHSEENSYAYMLEGADQSWHQIGNRREAYYSNLRPGKYIFRVKASNNDGVWNPQEATLHITVDPPFYQTWWAYLTYLVIISLIIMRIVQQQHRKHEREREEKYKQLEQDKMNELHEERMRMFTNFSHELRTPLTLIINPLNDLLQRVTFSPEVKEALQMIKKNTGRMLLLVNNLMDIQRYEAGKSILQKTRFNFSSFIREMYHSFESVAHNRDIRFTLENELPELYFTCYDEAEIEKVFFNLLSNAFKFTPANGCVTIRIKRISQSQCEMLPMFPEQQASTLIESSYLLIEIVDTGKGLNKEEAEKIFEPFYRAEEDIHKQVAGTGIGLSLTRSIVLQHQGCIWTDSSEEKGTDFLILLPDTEKQDIKKEEETVNPHSSEISKKVALLVEETEARNKQTVLLVDDNQEVLQYLEQQLQPDYIVMKAINGKDALEQLEGTFPNIVISDVMMPEMNGLELCKRIKESQDFCHIPVILLTAKSMVSQIEEGLEAGADDYIVKPFQVSLLKARIRNLLSLREKMKIIYGESLTLRNLGVEEPEEDNDFLTQYIDIVKANISNQELDVSVIYQALGMSRANFYRKVKAVTGLSPIELIKNIRLEAGAKLLKESNMNVSEIAQHIGFSSRSYFARSFKAVYGMSPTEYQEK